MAALDFRQKSEPRTSPGPIGRRGLIALILLLGVIVVVGDRLRQPETWQWLDRFTETSEDAPAAGPGIDNRLQPLSEQDSASDSFIISPPAPLPEDPSPRGKGYFPGVDPAMFDSVRDDKVSSPGERDCSLTLLDILNKTEQKELRKASVGKVTYAQLFRQSAHYRGRLATISGVVHGVEPIELPDNKYGIRRYYQVWLYPTDNPSSPVVVYCIDLPDGFPVGMKVSEAAEAVGFYFKRWAYQSVDGLRTAPTILAKTLRWKKRPAKVEKPPVDGRLIFLIVVIAALLAATTLWFVYMHTRPSHSALPDRPPNFDSLKELDQRNETDDESK